MIVVSASATSSDKLTITRISAKHSVKWKGCKGDGLAPSEKGKFGARTGREEGIGRYYRIVAGKEKRGSIQHGGLNQSMTRA